MPRRKPEPEEVEVTRCICGNEEFISTARTRALNAVPGLYVQCERCNVWQHGFCMGFESEQDIPKDYYCEKCQPMFHRIGQRQGVLQSRYRPYPLDVKPVPIESKPKEDESVQPAEEPEEQQESGALDTNKSSSSPPNSSKSDFSARKRKRKSREEVILQRVLEQSAKEAREAESKRRVSEGLPPLEEEALDSSAERSSAEPDTSTVSEKPSKPKKVKKVEEEEVKKPSRSGRPRNSRGNRRRTTTRSNNETSIKRSQNNLRRCKPRIPPQRSTFGEMRRRVAAILDFTSRTQDELHEELSVNITALKETEGAHMFQSELKNLGNMCTQNRSGLEQLTQKLLQWEETFGQF